MFSIQGTRDRSHRGATAEKGVAHSRIRLCVRIYSSCVLFYLVNNYVLETPGCQPTGRKERLHSRCTSVEEQSYCKLATGAPFFLKAREYLAGRGFVPRPHLEARVGDEKCGRAVLARAVPNRHYGRPARKRQRARARAIVRISRCREVAPPAAHCRRRGTLPGRAQLKQVAKHERDLGAVEGALCSVFEQRGAWHVVRSSPRLKDAPFVPVCTNTLLYGYCTGTL